MILFLIYFSGYLSNMYHVLTTEFTFNNILDALQGNTEQINRLRNTIRTVTSRDYFLTRPNSPTTEQLRVSFIWCFYEMTV